MMKQFKGVLVVFLAISLFGATGSFAQEAPSECDKQAESAAEKAGKLAESAATSACNQLPGKKCAWGICVDARARCLKSSPAKANKAAKSKSLSTGLAACEKAEAACMKAAATAKSTALKSCGASEQCKMAAEAAEDKAEVECDRKF